MGHLRVLTYNIHRAIGVDRRFRLDRIIEILGHYNADIAFLQEVDAGAPRSKRLDLTLEISNSLGYPYYAAGQNVRLRKGSYGNATLSRYPILSERNIDLTIASRKRRGCLYTSIQLHFETNKTISIECFNLHLGLSRLERVKQVGLLARSYEFKSVDQGRPCLVGGDFNDWRNFLSPIFLDILDFQSVSNDNSSPRKAFCSYPSFSPTGAIDRIYYRGNIRVHLAHRCRMGVAKVASDHLPIIIDFELL